MFDREKAAAAGLSEAEIDTIMKARGESDDEGEEGTEPDGDEVDEVGDELSKAYDTYATKEAKSGPRTKTEVNHEHSFDFDPDEVVKDIAKAVGAQVEGRIEQSVGKLTALVNSQSDLIKGQGVLIKALTKDYQTLKKSFGKMENVPLAQRPGRAADAGTSFDRSPMDGPEKTGALDGDMVSDWAIAQLGQITKGVVDAKVSERIAALRLAVSQLCDPTPDVEAIANSIGYKA